ncbi:hypothetical protein CRUP_008665, partial [Coryphaenoides rupestris]
MLTMRLLLCLLLIWNVTGCNNCIEMDIVSIVGLTAGNLFATVMIGVAVFLVASHAKTLPTTSGS